MKKHELLENYERLFKTKINELDDEEEPFHEPWMDESGNGWNEEYFDDNGVMNWINRVEELAYEIRNSVRGAYYRGGDTLEDMIEYLEGLRQELDDCINNLESELDV